MEKSVRSKPMEMKGLVSQKGLVKEIRSLSFKELCVHLLILCLRTIVLEAVYINKYGKILLRQSRITVTIMGIL